MSGVMQMQPAQLVLFQYSTSARRHPFLLRSVSQLSIISPKRYLEEQKKTWLSVVVPEENHGNESLDSSVQDTVITHRLEQDEGETKTKFRIRKSAVGNFI